MKQLGSSRFDDRERASEQLLSSDRPPWAHWRGPPRHPDREIRFRSRRLLAIMRQLDFQQRIEAFAADKSSAEGYGLPGWKRYREICGDGASTPTCSSK